MIAASVSEKEAYDELQAYTLELRDAAFIHQHVVDAWMLQHADETTKSIGVAFALVGMYLHFEKSFSGKEVQRAHMVMGKRSKTWPAFDLPAERGSMNATDVMAAPAGPERDRAIEAWSLSIWQAFHASHAAVADLAKRYGYG